ncbi:phosphotransferase [Kineosporia sp. A_224]|uniref:phosphotransferase n=1 Tax=Kineosporia sp. A_224 TaxID=1962180 RepID=UPI000B4BA0BD|nr:phosphotransferase [Kineosporia sp. A_224]
MPAADVLPPEVVRAAAGDGDLLDVVAEPLGGGMGAATASVVRFRGRVLRGGEVVPFSLVRKTVRPVTAGRHAAAAVRPDHWAHWHREPLAYASGLLPDGPHLFSPRCFGTGEDVVHLEDVTGPAPSPVEAAAALARWQTPTHVAPPALPWLADHPLAQRLAVTDLDLSAAPDARFSVLLQKAWTERGALLARLDDVPRVLTHGDLGLGNLVRADRGVVAIDWATTGTAPVGSDLALLVLSLDRPAGAEDVLAAYLDGTDPRLSREHVLLGYRVTALLTGVSRMQWMLARCAGPPSGYEDLLEEVADALGDLEP